MTDTVLGAIIAGFFGLIGIWFNHYLVNRKQKPETEKERQAKIKAEEQRIPEEIAKHQAKKPAPEITTAPTQREVRSKLTTVVSKKPVEKNIEVEAPVQKDNRTWWNELNGKWKNIFKKAIDIDIEPSERKLDKIVQLQELDCSSNYDQISDLEPLRQLTNLQ